MTSTPRVLVTGFEPFGGASLNSSQLVVEWLEAKTLVGLHFAVLPVEYEESVKEASALIDSIDPEIIISLGQAEGREKVSFERVAINLDDAGIADNGGLLRRDRAIVEGGEAAHMASLPVRKIVDRLLTDGHPVAESLSAGAFVCNHLFYSLLAELKETRSDRWMGFVHLPLMTEQGEEFPGKPTLSREVQGKTIEAAIELSRELRRS